MFGKGSGDEPRGAALRKLGLGTGKAIGTKQPMAWNSKWWSVRDLNPRPCACKAPALPLRQPTLCFPSWGRALIVPQNESSRNAGASRIRWGLCAEGIFSVDLIAEDSLLGMKSDHPFPVPFHLFSSKLLLPLACGDGIHGRLKRGPRLLPANLPKSPSFPSHA